MFYNPIVSLLVILLVQTAVMFAYTYWVTFRVMGRDYDAAVMAAGHCGFGMGAIPNAIANIQALHQRQRPVTQGVFRDPDGGLAVH